jgi:hypothetical protein
MVATGSDTACAGRDANPLGARSRTGRDHTARGAAASSSPSAADAAPTGAAIDPLYTTHFGSLGAVSGLAV